MGLVVAYERLSHMEVRLYTIKRVTGDEANGAGRGDGRRGEGCPGRSLYAHPLHSQSSSHLTQTLRLRALNNLPCGQTIELVKVNYGLPGE